MKRKSVVAAGLIAALVGGTAIPAFSESGGQGWSGQAGAQGMTMGNDGYGHGPRCDGQGDRMGGKGFLQGREHGPMGHPGMMGALVQKFDSNGDGRLSPDELRAGLTGELKQFDKNGDGTLSLDEYAALYAQLTHTSMVRHFQKMDSDGNGQISAAEMTAPADRMQKMQKAWHARQGNGQGDGQGAGQARGQGCDGKGGDQMHGMDHGRMGGMPSMQGRDHGPMGQPGMMDALVQKFDSNGDGRLSPDELSAGLTGELKQFDKNGDGTLSLDEYAALYAQVTHTSMVRHFQAMDSDGNGQISAEEMTAPADRLQRMQKAWHARQGNGQGMGQGGNGTGATNGNN